MRYVPDRCTGHCCRAFVLNLSPDEVYRALVARLNDGVWFDDEGNQRMPIGDRGGRDIETIALMLIPLGQHESPPGVRHCRTGSLTWWYTCRHLTPAGDCAIYAARPEMCRGFPYGRGCEYLDCTWGAARRERDEYVRAAQRAVLEDLGGEGGYA